MLGIGGTLCRWGVGSLCGNYHKTIIQIQIQDQVHIRVTIKPETGKNREKNPTGLGRG